MILSITRPGRAKAPLLTVVTEEPVKTAKDALRVALTKAGGEMRPVRGPKEAYISYLARLLGIKARSGSRKVGTSARRGGGTSARAPETPRTRGSTR